MPDPAVLQVFCIDHKNKQDNREGNVGVINGRMGELFGQEINGTQGRNRQTNKCQRRSWSPKRQANQTKIWADLKIVSSTDTCTFKQADRAAGR